MSSWLLTSISLSGGMALSADAAGEHAEPAENPDVIEYPSGPKQTLAIQCSTLNAIPVEKRIGTVVFHISITIRKYHLIPILTLCHKQTNIAKVHGEMMCLTGGDSRHRPHCRRQLQDTLARLGGTDHGDPFDRFDDVRSVAP